MNRYLRFAFAAAALLMAVPCVRAQVTYQLDGWPPSGNTNYEIFNNSMGTETEDCWVANSFQVIAGGNQINSVTFAVGNAQPPMATLTFQVTVALYTGTSLTSPAGLAIIPVTNTVTLTNVPTGSLQTVNLAAPTTLPTGQIFYAAILIRGVNGATTFPLVDDRFTPGPSPTNQLRSFFDVGPTIGAPYNLSHTANATRLGLSHAVVGMVQSEANLVLRVNATTRAGKVIWVDDASIGTADLDGANSALIWPNANGGPDVAINTTTGNIYWADNSSLPGKLMTGAHDGTGSASVVAMTVPGERIHFIAIDPAGTGTAYWCDFNAGHIWRAVLPNGAPTGIPSVSGIRGIALDLREGKMNLYVYDGVHLWRSNLDGTSPVMVANAIGDAIPGEFALDTVNDAVYVIGATNPHPGVPVPYIRRATLTYGGSPFLEDITTVLSGASDVGNTTEGYDIALDLYAGQMYWTSSNDAAAGQVRTAALDGSGNTVLPVTGLGGSIYRGITLFCGTPAAPNVFSRRFHNGVPFDINLPLTGNAGIECRSGGANNDYQLVFTFANPVTVGGAEVSAGTGSVGNISVSGATVTVNLTGVTNAQRITVTLLNVNDGTTTGDLGVPMGVLVGDTNANGAISSSDIAQVKSKVGQAVDATNFRADVNANGAISASDVALVKSQSGQSLPP